MKLAVLERNTGNDGDFIRYGNNLEKNCIIGIYNHEWVANV